MNKNTEKMNKSEFLKIEYLTLREEIKETKARIFRIMGIGLLGVPGITYLAKTFDVHILTIFLPFIVLVIGLIYLSENHALMRCGRYIRDNIEPNVEGIVGWEKWLTTPDIFQKRAVDTYLFLAFYLLYLVYFSGSSFLAVSYIYSKYSIMCASSALGAYVFLGGWSSFFIYKNKLVSTTTLEEKIL